MRQVPGFFAAVDRRGLLAEVGWEKDPTLMHLAWAAQWLDYAAELRTNLSQPALVVPVFEDAIMQACACIAPVVLTVM